MANGGDSQTDNDTGQEHPDGTQPPVDGSLEVGEGEASSSVEDDSDERSEATSEPSEPPSGGGGSGGGAGDSGGEDSDGGGNSRWYGRMSRGKKLLLPLLTLGFLAIILISFHTILLPFVFACAIVYLMEPIVRRMSPMLPRWTAVILVYVTFFSVISLGVLFVVPRFVSEIVRFAETVPEAVTEFREENLPGINERVQQFLEDYLPVSSGPPDFRPAKSVVSQAREHAARTATATAVARARGRAAADMHVKLELTDDDGEVTQTYTVEPSQTAHTPADFDVAHGSWSFAGQIEQPVVRLKSAPDGSLEVYLEEGEVEVARVDDQVWQLRRPPPAGRSEEPNLLEVRSLIDLEARVNEMIENAISSSNERISALVGYAQTLVVGIIQLFVAIILTFMVAAFMSIDLPSFMSFFRGMLPRDYRDGYQELLGRVDRGLSGVVRGQLTICLVNGVLTYVGLVLLDIRFSLLLAVVAAVLSLIPIFGTVISTIPIVIIALMDGFWTGVLALAWILGIHALEANILNPKIIGTSAHIHPVIVIFALLAGESTFGLVGALLAVPCASILLELYKFARDKLWPSEEGATEPAPSPEPSPKPSA